MHFESFLWTWVILFKWLHRIYLSHWVLLSFNNTISCWAVDTEFCQWLFNVSIHVLIHVSIHVLVSLCMNTALLVLLLLTLMWMGYVFLCGPFLASAQKNRWLVCWSHFCSITALVILLTVYDSFVFSVSKCHLQTEVVVTLPSHIVFLTHRP